MITLALTIIAFITFSLGLARGLSWASSFWAALYISFAASLPILFCSFLINLVF